MCRKVERALHDKRLASIANHHVVHLAHTCLLGCDSSCDCQTLYSVIWQSVLGKHQPLRGLMILA